eukprot:maker-scaffold776_size99073-snap-gene-0.15 protein:Tk00559 transcript:maker-scaffold776_size99073-snap-gene-0.15-mRNA-1 annotation:"denn domain-containing protein 1a"
MGGRLRPNVQRAFDCFAEVVAGDETTTSPWILQTFPPDFRDREAEALKSVPAFVFPCQNHMQVSTVQNFSFVTTNLEAQFTYGFVRHAPRSETALVILSGLPWHETFYRILNHAAELILGSNDGELERFLAAIHGARVPDLGTVFHISWEATPDGPRKDFTCPVAPQHGLPTIPENRNLTEYYNAVGIHNMLVIFASMLFERRIIITSKRLSRLSACVQAANAIIYPMQWQHIFIPVLPLPMIDYLSAPMPFLVGVPAPLMAKVRLNELGEAVILDADTNVVRSPFNDLDFLPLEVTANLKRSLKDHRDLLGDSVARAFLQALVHLIGGYRDALKFRQGGQKISFSDDAFIASRSSSLQPFLEQMLQLQIFRQFIEERLEMLNSGRGFSDEFEDEVIRFQESQNNNSKFKQQYAQISSSVKKEGGALVKAVRSKANPAVKSAVKSVKHGGRGLSTKSKSAYREMRSKMKASGSNLDGSGSSHPSSAPSSPVLGQRQLSISSMSSVGSFCSTRNLPTSSGGLNSSNGSGDSSRNPGLIRNNTDLNLGRILKYERFDPPPLSGVPLNPFASSHHNNHVPLVDQSPEMEGPMPLDLDLMSDLQDVIFQANKNGTTKPAPPINRHLKPNFRRSHASFSSTPTLIHDTDDDEVLELAPDEKAAEATKSPFRGRSSLQGEHPMVARQLALTTHEASEAGPRKPSLGDLIKLDSKSPEEEVVFDPLLLQIDAKARHALSPNFPMPKPPSTSTLPQMAKLFQDQHHKPLERANNNPFFNGNPIPSESIARRPAMPNRTALTKSSDDLLQEYGIDFNKLSLASANSHALRSQNSNPTRDPGVDPFADLDPLRVGGTAHKPHLPLAPPRGNKKQAQIWTTFE